MHKDPLKKFF